MEKVVVIEGKEIKLRTHGNVPNLYEKYFGKDLFIEIDEMGKGGIKLSTFNNFLWLAAKIADPKIPLVDEWNESFDSLPVVSVIEELQDMLMKLMPQGKQVPPKAVAKKR